MRNGLPAIDDGGHKSIVEFVTRDAAAASDAATCIVRA